MTHSEPDMHYHTHTMTLQFVHNAMGCEWDLTLAGEDRQTLYDVSVEVWELIDRLDGQLSHYKEKSEISYINAVAAHEPVLVEPGLFQLLLFARDMWELTDGALDITAGAAGRKWGFETGLLPSEGVYGMSHVTLDPDRRLIAFDDPGVRIELGALGKGYAVDRAIELLGERGIKAAFLSAGASSAHGFGKPWPIRIGDREVTIDNEGVSTSGPLEQSIEGRSHLIDPATGEPSRSDVSVTVLALTALEAEALSTAVALRPTPASIPDWLLSYMTLAPGIRVFVRDRSGGRTALSSDEQGKVTREENHET